MSLPQTHSWPLHSSLLATAVSSRDPVPGAPPAGSQHLTRAALIYSAHPSAPLAISENQRRRPGRRGICVELGKPSCILDFLPA